MTPARQQVAQLGGFILDIFNYTSDSTCCYDGSDRKR